MFFRKSPQIEVTKRLRRVCDLTSPNIPRVDDARSDNRQNRCVPVLLAPWHKKKVVSDQIVSALTRDISDRGLSVLLTDTFCDGEVVVGMWLVDVYEHPFFILGETRDSFQIGGGFWALGIETKRMLGQSEAAPLFPLAEEHLQTPELISSL